jgi:hypothetical protein
VDTFHTEKLNAEPSRALKKDEEGIKEKWKMQEMKCCLAEQSVDKVSAK